MKKIPLLLAIVGIVFLTSCENENSLEGTTWKFRREFRDGGWIEETLIFSSTDATYHKTSSNRGNKDSDFTGTYTYDPPRVVIEQEVIGFDNQPAVLLHKGTVERKTMTIGIYESLDMVAITEFKKQ
jgi:hypothetical protein